MGCGTPRAMTELSRPAAAATILPCIPAVDTLMMSKSPIWASSKAAVLSGPMSAATISACRRRSGKGAGGSSAGIGLSKTWAS